MRVTWTLALSAVLAACTPAIQASDMNTDLALTVQPDPARPGQPVELTLRNGTAADVGYNLCTSGLERRAGESWQAVPSDRVCTMELRLLPPGDQARYPLDLEPELAPGEYRFRTRVERMQTGDREDVVSRPFQVRATAER